MSGIAWNAFAIISYVMPSRPGVFPFTAVGLQACSNSSIETGSQSQLWLKNGLVTSQESGGGLGNNVFLKALYLPSKVLLPLIKGIKPYDDGLVYNIALKIDFKSVFSRKEF